jgi:DNA repair exonuclease SbcCD ATPase subunit
VAQAVDALLKAGFHPTVAQVKDRLGGGSYTTISRYLRPLMADRGGSGQNAADIPADLAEIGRRAVLSIYVAIQSAANSRVEIIEREAGQRINHAERARTEAELEIEKLEREATTLLEERDTAAASAQQAAMRAERAEAQREAITADVDRLRAEFEQQRREAERVRNDGAEERGQLSAELERPREESARLATQIAALQQRQKAPIGASGR